MGAITSYEHPTAGRVKVVAPAVKLSVTPAEVRAPAPHIGQHSREVLEHFGFSNDEIDRFIARNAVAQAADV